MSDANLTLLGQVAPEYESFSDATRFAVLKGIAECFVDPTIFTCTEDYAVTLLIAHMLKIGERSGAGGQVGSDKTDKLRKTYTKNNASGNQELSATSYGQEYLRCRKAAIIKPIIWS